MRQVLIALVLLAAGSVLAYMHVVTQTYHPVTRVSSPDGLVFTAVQAATQERHECGVANERFLTPVKTLCTRCKVMAARCERELEPFERAVLQDEALTHYQVSAKDLHLAIEGPAAAARESCELMAGALRKMGVPSAACLFPRSGS